MTYVVYEKTRYIIHYTANLFFVLWLLIITRNTVVLSVEQSDKQHKPAATQ